MLADRRFDFRRYRPGDEEAILDLFARSFGASRTLDHWRWKYQQNPFGNEHISLAWDADCLVAQYAAYSIPFWRNGAEMFAHHIADIMTDRSVRHVGRGSSSVFARTALHFYENFCEGKVAFNYGFNTATSREFSIRFTRAEAVEPVTYRVRENVHRLSRLRRWLSGYTVEPLRDVGPEYDAFFRRVAPAYGFVVERSSTYMRWRYLQSAEPGYFVVAIRKRGRLAGWSAFRLRDETLLWGDALFDPAASDAPEILLRHVALRYAATRVEGWFSRRPAWFDAILQRLGFVVMDEPNDLSLSCVPFTFTDAISAMRTSLYYTMGDSDLF